MIDRTIAFAFQQRYLVLVTAGLLVGLGVYAMHELPIDAVPDLTNVQVQINTAAPALAPPEVEKLITFPIETAMSGLPDLEEIRSISKHGLSQVTVVFKDRVDIYFARQLVLERLQEARERIPEGAGDPSMGPITTALGEIYQYVVESDRHDPTELRTLQDWVIKPQLRTVPGVAEINSMGGYVKQYQVLLDPSRLLAYDLTLHQVFEAVAHNNANAGGSYLEHSGERYLIRGIGLVRSLEDIGDIVVASHNGVPLHVRDVAAVTLGAEPRVGAATEDGRGEVVIGMAMMLKDENSRTVAQRVRAKLARVQESMPPGVRLRTIYDRTELVNKTIHTVQKNLFEGGLLVVAVLLALLGNLRAALIVASAIPLSMLFAFLGMQRLGISGNLMSLGAIDFGLIVDGAVVMVENSVRRLAEAGKEEGKPLSRARVLQTVLAASQEVGRPVVFAVGIIIIVYLPILTLQGMEGKMFRPMAYTVTMALAGSLLLSLTLIPTLCSFILKANASERENRLMAGVKRLYRPALVWALGHRRTVLGGALAFFLLSLTLFPMLGSEFVPKLDEGTVLIQPIRLPSVSLEESIRLTSRVETILKRFPEVANVFTRTGTAEVATDPMGINISDTYVQLKPRHQWRTGRTKTELIEAMEQSLQKLPGQVYAFMQPIEMRVSELVAGVRSDVAIKVFGEDMDTLRERAEAVTPIVSEIRGAEDVKVEQVSGVPVLQIVVDRHAIARYGINVADVQEVVETAIGGKAATQVIEGEKRFDLVVQLPEPERNSPETIRNILVSAPGGERLPLGQLAAVSVVPGPAQISREHAQRRVVVELNVRGRDIGSFVAEAQERLRRRIRLPAGYYLEWGGQFENMQRARLRLAIVVPVVLFLIFILLFTTFNSARQALLIYTGIPLAISGGILALLVRQMPFSISAGVGFIALFGVAVLNGVVMVSYTNSLRQQGLDLKEAVVEGTMVRLRPVLMTALVASLGFVPMALATGTGAEVQKPLATVVIGGLVTSTALTLLVLPILYAWFEREETKVEI